MQWFQFVYIVGMALNEHFGMQLTDCISVYPNSLLAMGFDFWVFREIFIFYREREG